MEDISVLMETGVIDESNHRAHVDGEKISRKRIGLSPAVVALLAEGGVNFFRYLKSLGMSGETNLVVLSSKHHYYYEENDLKNVRILVNLKKLNLIKHLEAFLNSLVRILPPDTNFIGYFSDNNPVNGNVFRFSKLSRLYHRFNNILDSRTDRFMNKNEVTELLERNGFEVINMTRMNGLIYFNSLNIYSDNKKSGLSVRCVRD